MTQRRDNSAGFTLMEVVVATTLMSLIMITLVLGLRVAANAWRRGEQKLEEHAVAMSGTDVMGQQISSAAVRITTEFRGVQRTAFAVIAFEGTPQAMRFSTRLSWRGDHSRPQYMADYRVVKTQAGKQQLVVSETGLTDDDSVLRALRAPVAESGQPVGAEADQVQLAYLRPATANDPQQWVGTWEPLPNAEFPEAVQVRWFRGNRQQEAVFPIAMNHIVKDRP